MGLFAVGTGAATPEAECQPVWPALDVRENTHCRGQFNTATQKSLSHTPVIDGQAKMGLDQGSH
jgi:hypothetical protein